MGFIINSKNEIGFTHIPNFFIHTYMPTANGNYVKIYLYLLMACQNPAEADDLSVDALADRMECTENDILRALRYWKKEGLLSVAEENSEIHSITLLDPWETESAAQASAAGREAAEPPIPAVKPEPLISAAKPELSAGGSAPVIKVVVSDRPTEENHVPPKQVYTPSQAEALSKDIEINRTISTVEQLLGAPVSPAHLQLILYFMCDVGFTSELMVTLYETAIKKGKKKPNYIEAIGISWAQKGITTADQARDEAAQFSGRYSVVSRAYGLSRSLAPAEREIIDGWEQYHFSDAIIDEACRRTVLQTGDTNLNYTSRILEGWHKQDVISLEDVARCDKNFQRQKKSSGSTVKKSGAGKNQFQNFPQRAYSQGDYSSLEKKLLQGQK